MDFTTVKAAREYSPKGLAVVVIIHMKEVRYVCGVRLVVVTISRARVSCRASWCSLCRLFLYVRYKALA